MSIYSALLYGGTLSLELVDYIQVNVFILDSLSEFWVGTYGMGLKYTI